MTATGTIKAIYLGNFSSLDSYEADYVSEHAGNLVGVTRDYTQMKLVAVTYYDKDHNGVDFARNPHLKPILIKAGSLGNGLPERDTLYSPNHRLLINNEKTALFFDEREVLVAAKHLVGAPGVHDVDVMGTTYIHFMFDHHEVVLSNGSWTESFQPGDMSLKGVGDAQRSEILELFPELRTKEGIQDYQSARRSLKKHEAKLLLK